MEQIASVPVSWTGHLIKLESFLSKQINLYDFISSGW
jgi:hypothetical protein